MKFIEEHKKKGEKLESHGHDSGSICWIQLRWPRQRKRQLVQGPSLLTDVVKFKRMGMPSCRRQSRLLRQ